MTESPSKPRGRPAKLKMPERIHDTPQNIMRAVFNTKPKMAGEWKYMKAFKRAESARKS